MFKQLAGPLKTGELPATVAVCASAVTNIPAVSHARHARAYAMAARVRRHGLRACGHAGASDELVADEEDHPESRTLLGPRSGDKTRIERNV